MWRSKLLAAVAVFLFNTTVKLVFLCRPSLLIYVVEITVEDSVLRRGV
jgi:hypothetical protein